MLCTWRERRRASSTRARARCGVLAKATLNNLRDAPSRRQERIQVCVEWQLQPSVNDRTRRLYGDIDCTLLGRFKGPRHLAQMKHCVFEFRASRFAGSSSVLMASIVASRAGFEYLPKFCSASPPRPMLWVKTWRLFSASHASFSSPESRVRASAHSCPHPGHGSGGMLRPAVPNCQRLRSSRNSALPRTCRKGLLPR